MAASPLHVQPIGFWRGGCARVICAAASTLVMVGCAAPESEGSALVQSPEPIIAKGMFSDDPPPELQITDDPAASPLTPQQQRQLQIFKVTLLNPSPDIDSETRRSAAHELLAMGTPEALQTLEEALASRRSATMIAAISAMQAAPTPVPELMNSAISALPTAPSSTLDTLCWAVARYGEPARDAVADLALDRSAAMIDRRGPIAALSAFESRGAAASLMQIIDHPDESPEIVALACEGLQRLSGLSYNTDVAQWRAWWQEASSLPAGQWSAFITKSLSKRAAQLHQELIKQREASDRMARELFAAYRDLYPALPIEEQLRRLPTLLQDQLPPVREFAISRISLLLRDSVRIPPEVQDRLAERLHDDSPALRMQAAKLLDELNYEAAGPMIAARLTMESTTDIIASFLEVLMKRPCAEAIEPATRWLSDAELSDRAATVVWRSLKIRFPGEEQLPTLQSEVRRALAQRGTPQLMRVLAWIGDQYDVEHLTEALDGDEAPYRAAVAEGFLQRDLRQPLLDRAADAAVFPFAVRAATEGVSDLGTFRRVVGWTPNEANRQVWLDGILMMVAALQPKDLIAADDALLAASNLDLSLRSAVLARAASLPREEFSAADRLIVLARYLPILLEQGDAAQAFALLDGVNCQSPEFQSICFKAAALAGQFDKAGEVQANPGAWVELLAQAAERDLTSCAPLCREIARRFEGRLSDDEQATVDHIAQMLRESAGASANAAEINGPARP